MGLVTSASLILILQTIIPVGTHIGRSVSYQIEGIEQRSTNSICTLKLNTAAKTYEFSMSLEANENSQQALIFDDELGEEALFSANADFANVAQIKQDFSDSAIHVRIDDSSESVLRVIFESVGAGDKKSLTCTFKK